MSTNGRLYKTPTRQPYLEEIVVFPPKTLCVGDKVHLDIPHNPLLDGAIGTVYRIEEWGVHIHTDRAATGVYRAAWCEITLLHNTDQTSQPKSDKDKHVPSAAEGALCDRCGGVNLLRTGSCITCQDCGANSGCS